MANVVLIFGQSHCTMLRDKPISGLIPQPGTFMWSSSGWVPPVNNMIALCNDLRTIQHDAYVINVGVGGTGLVSTAAVPSGYWLDLTPGSPLKNLLAAISGYNVLAAVFIQGENDAYYNTSKEAYAAGLLQLYSILCGEVDKSPGDLPFVVTPLGPDLIYPHRRQILAAQFAVEKYPGMLVGPDFSDLPLDTDGAHLTAAGYTVLAQRLAAFLAPILANATYEDEPPPPPQYTLVKALAPTLSISGISNNSYRCIVGGLLAGGTRPRVRFVAPPSLPFALKHASIGVQAANASTTLPPVELLFNGEHGFSLSPGQSIWGEASANVMFSQQDKLVVIVDIAAVGGNIVYIYPGGDGNWGKATAESYTEQNPSGFTLSAGVGAAGFDRIEDINP